ncbi:proteasome subunit alpha [Brevibacterium album]|uniref:proteasome subunit alpha n=1 Tax=Brevibacterium album TaxID=417948 RepID=UPI0003F60DEC|nr:proteasome subunit alpha [Brevibacterium album]
MTVPFYVSPEQLMKDRADFARKGIARGRSVLVLGCADGILLLAENASPSLNKLAEIYDRIGFAAVGKYNEFEGLRQAGVRYADLRGYSYERSDVTARGLANAYAQTLAGVFTNAQKPYEVELVVAELGTAPAADRLFRVSYDGSIADERSHVALGGGAEAITARLDAGPGDLAGLGLREALAAGREAMGLTADSAHLEAALLDRTRLGASAAQSRRTFRRLTEEELA